ncbi:MAG: alanyl-tRNA editing protein [Gammaproteobacteria bacterium]|nr:alanyl-tRNA editing protein [Gammaproteobacteria bacterium]
MRTQKLYYFDTYKTEHKATVIAIDPESQSIELDETIFHPQGGGQPSDKGTIEGIAISRVVETADGVVQHHLVVKPEFQIGAVVTLLVDLPPRLMYAKLHSAGHAIAHIAEREFPGIKAIQGHHFPGEARVEFSFTELPDATDFTVKITDGLKSVVSHARAVDVGYDSGVRKITMGDFPVTPCGGTHVRDLSEIDGVKIRSVKKNKDRLRVGYGFPEY